MFLVVSEDYVRTDMSKSKVQNSVVPPEAICLDI